MRVSKQFLAFVMLWNECVVCLSLSLPHEMDRRRLGKQIASTTGAVLSSAASICTSPALATDDTAPYSPNGLASKLAKLDPSLLKNSVFNVPPSAQVYPDFMRGTWRMTSTFGGYLFPSTRIGKDRLMQNALIPGFQKCSIAGLSDIGIEKPVTYVMTIDPTTGLDDRVSTLKSTIDGYLGYSAVSNVLYEDTKPNRISIDFVDYKTKNAERIELFCNARESEVYRRNTNIDVFVCSEFIRQVTFSGSPDVGIPRQVVTNYAHFYTYKFDTEGDRTALAGNILTAAYLDPQDAMFFEEPTKPVVVYSHVLSGIRL